MISGLVTESNCAIRMNAIRKAASRKAASRNVCDSCCSCCWPVNCSVYPVGSDAMNGAISSRTSATTALALNPARTSDEMVTTRLRSLRVTSPRPRLMLQLATEESGICAPSFVTTTRSPNESRSSRYSAASRTVMSYSSSPARNWEATRPLIALRIVLPMSEVFSSYRAARSRSTCTTSSGLPAAMPLFRPSSLANSSDSSSRRTASSPSRFRTAGSGPAISMLSACPVGGPMAGCSTVIAAPAMPSPALARTAAMVANTSLARSS